VAGMSSAHAPESRGFGFRGINRRPITAVSWMCAAFLIAFALAVVVLIIFGVGERGTAIALRATARWSFLLFWLAYAGGAIAWLFGPRLDGLARHGRKLGLAFASAQLVHVGLVLWIIHITTGPSGAMVFFWVDQHPNGWLVAVLGPNDRQRRLYAVVAERMTAGGRFLTKGITKVKGEAALSILAYNILRAINLIGPFDLRARLA